MRGGREKGREGGGRALIGGSVWRLQRPEAYLVNNRKKERLEQRHLSGQTSFLLLELAW